MLYVFAPTPTPPWQVFGGVVHTVRVPWHSAAQNISPSMPAVVPAPFGVAVCTYPPVLFSSDDAKVVHSGAGFFPVTRYTLPVNFAGASGPIGGLYCGLPSMCSCQFPSAAAAPGCLFGTIAFA